GRRFFRPLLGEDVRLHERSPVIGVAMGAIASIIIAISIVVLVYAFLMKRKASRVTNAQHMQSGSVSQAPNGAPVSVQGRPVAAPLVSPVTGTPCLYYELEVEGFWKEGENKKSKKYLEDRQ